jgi:DNA replication protein DnaC
MNWQETLQTLTGNMNRMLQEGDRKSASVEAAKAAQLLFTEAKASSSFDRKQQFANRAAQFLELSVEIREGNYSAPVDDGDSQSRQRRKIKSGEDDEKTPQFPLADSPYKFADVAGLEDAKETLLAYVNTFRHVEAARKRGLKIGGGLLFYGPPGTGKTMLAQAVAGELGMKICPASGADLKGRLCRRQRKERQSVVRSSPAKSEFRAFYRRNRLACKKTFRQRRGKRLSCSDATVAGIGRSGQE